MNQDLSFLECKMDFNRKQFLKKNWTFFCSRLEYYFVITVHNSSSLLSSSKEIEKKDTLGQNSFEINTRTVIAFHHIIKLGKRA